MKYKEIQLLTNDELKEKLVAEKALLSKLKFAHAISPIENPMKIRETRRTIAKLNTELTKRKV
jgi:large subunit ribosomal protein L29